MPGAVGTLRSLNIKVNLQILTAKQKTSFCKKSCKHPSVPNYNFFSHGQSYPSFPWGSFSSNLRQLQPLLEDLLLPAEICSHSDMRTWSCWCLALLCIPMRTYPMVDLQVLGMAPSPGKGEPLHPTGSEWMCSCKR